MSNLARAITVLISLFLMVVGLGAELHVWTIDQAFLGFCFVMVGCGIAAHYEGWHS